jgi:5-methylcytosine-specific restriction endonuclease McrA
VAREEISYSLWMSADTCHLACGTDRDRAARLALHFRDGMGASSRDEWVIPWSQGGSDDMSNLRTMCRSCNSSRGTRTDHEWLRSVGVDD